MTRTRRRHWEEAFFKGVMLLTLFVILGMLTLILFTVIRKGLSAMNWQMLTQTSGGGYYLGGEGGILNAILGSLYLAGGGTVLSLLIGLPVVLYLHLYMGSSLLPIESGLSLTSYGNFSIVYGAFGFTVMLLVGMRASLMEA
jgi:phosphate transport system permease protein